MYPKKQKARNMQWKTGKFVSHSWSGCKMQKDPQDLVLKIKPKNENKSEATINANSLVVWDKNCFKMFFFSTFYCNYIRHCHYLSVNQQRKREKQKKRNNNDNK